MIFSLNLTTKEVKHRFPEKSGEGNEDDSYRGYALDIGHFDNDKYEGKNVIIIIIEMHMCAYKYYFKLFFFCLFIDVVVSAPRGSSCKGFVEIFNSTFNLLHIIYGYQVRYKNSFILLMS